MTEKKTVDGPPPAENIRPLLRPSAPVKGALASYARPGNIYDNTQAEAGWSTLNTELRPHGGAFASLEKARREVA